MKVEFEVAYEEEDATLSGRSKESDLERLRCMGKWRKGSSLDVVTSAIGGASRGLGGWATGVAVGVSVA
jgi:hypothetical protein